MACARAGASAFLEAMPTSRRTIMSDTDLRFALRFRHGLDTMPAHAIGQQCVCGRHILADDADHALTCAATGGAGTVRHDSLNGQWCHLARIAGVSSAQEPVLRQLQRRADDAGRGPRRAGRQDTPPTTNDAADDDAAAANRAAAQADATQAAADPAAAVDAIVEATAQLQLARAGGAGDAGADVASGARGDALLSLPTGLIVADISVIHPGAATYVDKACKVAGAAAAVRDAEKIRKYRASPLGGACEFVPLSVETYGRMEEPAMGG